jgi:hypothetical protein
MTRIILYVACMAALSACNNASKETKQDKDTTTSTQTTAEPTKRAVTNAPAAGSATASYSINDTLRTFTGSILVQKDKSNLSPGNDYLGIVTVNGSNKETFVVNFLFTLKPGLYPVVGISFSRDLPNGKGQVFGGILGGKPKMTNYKVNITQMENTGSNNAGGNRWKIGGTIEEEVTIDAMGLMKLDKEHPASIKVNKISFANLGFDDNWEEMIKKTMDRLKK